MKILDSTYEKEDLENVSAKETQLNAEERTQIIGILKDFEDLFGGTLGDWEIYPIGIELKTNYKTLNCKYNPLPSINKETIIKEIDTYRNRSVSYGKKFSIRYSCIYYP